MEPAWSSLGAQRVPSGRFSSSVNQMAIVKIACGENNAGHSRVTKLIVLYGLEVYLQFVIFTRQIIMTVDV